MNSEKKKYGKLVTLDSPKYGTIKCYYTADDRLYPYYDDPITQMSLVGPLNGGALRRAIDEHAMKHGYKLVSSNGSAYMQGSDGKRHHIALFNLHNGRLTINTFKQPELPSFAGANQDYSPDAVGFTLFSRGLEQNAANFLKEVGLSGEVLELDNSQKELSEEEYERLRQKQDRMQRDAIRQIEQQRTKKQHIQELNFKEIEKAITERTFLVPRIKERRNDWSVYVPNPLIKALSLRGITAYDLSKETLSRLGFVTELFPFTNKGERYRHPISGVAFKLDDNESWQIRLMKGDISASLRSVNNNPLRYVSKGDKGPRFTTIGQARPFLLNSVMERITQKDCNPHEPIFISEGPFDAISIEGASYGSALSVSLQGCQNISYLLESVNQLVSLGHPVIIAYDKDKSGVYNGLQLESDLHKAGIPTYQWPGALLKEGDFNDLLKQYPEAANSLINNLRETVIAAENGDLNYNKVFAMLGNSERMPIPKNATSKEYGHYILKRIEAGASPQTIGRLDIDKTLDKMKENISASLRQPVARSKV